jgi:predicted GNAT family N-acyltransferase
MDLKIEAFGENNSNYMRAALNLRFEIYTEELKIDKFREFDGLDKDATHYLLFVDMLPVGVCRWRREQDHLIIDRFGIKKNSRGNGYGFLLLKYVINELALSKSDIQILAVRECIPFLNVIGFKDIVEEIGYDDIELLKLLFNPVKAK